MKRGVLIVAFFIFLVLIASSFASAGFSDWIKRITGQATSQPTNVSVVIGALPTLAIDKPKNHTYFSNQSLKVEVGTNADNIWYNLDKGANISFPQNQNQTFFNTTYSNHTIYVFANTSLGVTTKNVTFYVVNGIFSINNTRFGGNSTNFNEFSFLEMQNLSGIIFDEPASGKIKFSVPINLTDDHNPQDGFCDVNRFINISFNKIDLNSSGLPNFNKSATLEIANLTFVNPRIVMNGIVCPLTICVKNSYVAGVLSFNISHFTSFSAEEDTTSLSPESGSGSSSTGGNYGGVISDIIFDKDRIQVSLKQGEIKREELAIKNNGNRAIRLSFSTLGIKDLVSINEEKFELKAGESKIISLNFKADEDILPDLYVGQLHISKLSLEGYDLEKEIPIAIEIEQKKSLLDVILNIPESSLVIDPRDDLLATITLYNLGQTGRVDVVLAYTVKNSHGKDISFEEETIAVETQNSFLKEIELPVNLKEGTYILSLKASYGDQVAFASAWFSVKERNNEAYYILFGVILFVLIFFFIVFRILKTSSIGAFKSSDFYTKNIILKKRKTK